MIKSVTIRKISPISLRTPKNLSEISPAISVIYAIFLAFALASVKSVGVNAISERITIVLI
jgi:hypothetical protein